MSSTSAAGAEAASEGPTALTLQHSHQLVHTAWAEGFAQGKSASTVRSPAFQHRATHPNALQRYASRIVPLHRHSPQSSPPHQEADKRARRIAQAQAAHAAGAEEEILQLRAALEDMRRAAGQEPSRLAEELRVWKAAHAEIEAQVAQAQAEREAADARRQLADAQQEAAAGSEREAALRLQLDAKVTELRAFEAELHTFRRDLAEAKAAAAAKGAAAEPATGAPPNELSAALLRVQKPDHPPLSRSLTRRGEVTAGVGALERMEDEDDLLRAKLGIGMPRQAPQPYPDLNPDLNPNPAPTTRTLAPSLTLSRSLTYASLGASPLRRSSSASIVQSTPPSSRSTPGHSRPSSPPRAKAALHTRF